MRISYNKKNVVADTSDSTASSKLLKGNMKITCSKRSNIVIATDLITDADYIEQLATTTIEMLPTDVYTATYKVDNDYLTFIIESESGEYTYVQPIADIIPKAEDLKDDALSLANSIITELDLSETTEYYDENENVYSFTKSDGQPVTAVAYDAELITL